jgi:hypothetical protein
MIAVVIAFLLPLGQDSRSASARLQCRNNVKNIALALYNYAVHYDALPPAYTVDADGRPLHSWRTLILPYLDEQRLYAKIDLSKPWDNSANAEAHNTIPRVYQCPSGDRASNYTSYLAIVGANACFHATQPRANSEITDDTSETLMVFEGAAEQAVHWMAPQDADERMVLSLTGNGNLTHSGGTNVATVSGSVQFLSDRISQETLRALISIAGNERIGEF